MSDRFLRSKKLDEITGVSRTTRWRLERAGLFPRRRFLSANSVGWLESEIVAWVREQASERVPGRFSKTLEISKRDKGNAAR